MTSLQQHPKWTPSNMFFFLLCSHFLFFMHVFCFFQFYLQVRCCSCNTRKLWCSSNCLYATIKLATMVCNFFVCRFFYKICN
jgi:hypothetical protein